MKSLILSLILFSSFALSAQTVKAPEHPLDDYRFTQAPDPSLRSLCNERGHAWTEYVNIAQPAVYCPPYLVESDTISILVTPSCRTEAHACMRCGDIITKPVPEKREVIWRKQER